MHLDIHITRVTSLEDCERCRDIAAAVWGADAACSAAQMSVHAKYGGVVLLAWDGERPVGFLFSFPARYRDEWVLWSHETAVLPEYLHCGIGSRLKFTQRELARDEGYKTIAWTYDPLVSRNAHFNLNKLGARVSEYKVNAYGADESDLVNQGIETDRFIAVWSVHGEAARTHADSADRWPALRVGQNGFPETSMQTKNSPFEALNRAAAGETMPMVDGSGIVTEIPFSFETLSREEKIAWREAFRTAAHALSGSGWSPVAFEHDGVRAGYVWQR